MTFTPIDWIIFFSVPALAWILSLHKRQIGTWRGYFLANAGIGKGGSVATYFGANLTFTAIFLILSEEAYKRGVWVFAVPVFWLAGTLFLYWSYPRIQRYVQEGKTLHQAIGEAFESVGMQRWASFWTIVAFVGTVGLEFYGGIRLLEWANLPFFHAVFVAMLLAFAVGTFTMTGGFRGVMLADVVLDIVAGIGTLILLFSLAQLVWSKQTIPMIVGAGNAASLTDNILFVVGMGIIFFPFQLCALDSWQRFASWKHEKNAAPQWLLWGSLGLALAYCAPILIGITVRAYGLGIPGTNDHPLKWFLDYIHLKPVLIGIVLTGFFAAILSTADELLNCCALSLLFDIIRIPRSNEQRTDVQERRLVLSGQLYTGFFAIASAMLALLAVKYERNISDMAIAVFSGQVLFTFPLFLLMFFPEKAKGLAGTAKRSMIIGFMGIILIVITGWALKDRTISDAAPIGGTILSLLIYLPQIPKLLRRNS